MPKKQNNPFSEENVKAYNKMKFTKDPTGILPDESYESGRDLEGEKSQSKMIKNRGYNGRG